MAKQPVVVPDELSQEDLDEIRSDIEAIIALEAERKSTNADIDAVRKKVLAKGISAEGLRASLARFKMDREQRAEFDRSRGIVDKALGIPIQGDLFAGDAETSDQKPAPATAQSERVTH